ncbi:hypothetical protein CEXT_77201 [Caerostris extrusa]|uniref:HNH homing endonuclease n=1 Tax=Caerostris extrusa TaxID=172846 RepID=A0AAV4P5Q6_CAEEX|nr:hypothetical protein CEXT_77201 [Caerostris extrusa]
MIHVEHCLPQSLNGVCYVKRIHVEHCLLQLLNGVCYVKRSHVEHRLPQLLNDEEYKLIEARCGRPRHFISSFNESKVPFTLRHFFCGHFVALFAKRFQKKRGGAESEGWGRTTVGPCLSFPEQLFCVS